MEEQSWSDTEPNKGEVQLYTVYKIKKVGMQKWTRDRGVKYMRKGQVLQAFRAVKLGRREYNEQ